MNFSAKTSVKPAGHNRRLTNLLALDFAATGVKAVRLQKTKDGFALAAADILPSSGPDATVKPAIPKPLSAYYVALCATMEDSVIRVFNQVVPEDEDIEALVRQQLSSPADHRVGGLVLSQGAGKRESTLLGVAVPEKAAQHYLSLFSDGAPAPYSLEPSGLAAFSAFLFNYGEQTEHQTVCLIEAGARSTSVAFLCCNQLQLVSRFDVGGESVQRQVQAELGVDYAMAGSVLFGGSIDVSAPVRQVLNPLTRQLAIYREFVERQSKTALSAIYISGGQAKSPHWQTAIKEVLGFIPQVWNPFEKIEILSGAFPEYLEGQQFRFAAAVGAALAGMEEL